MNMKNMNMNVRKAQGGFTLIELVIVIVLLGILAAVAVPRFIDLSTEAANASAEGFAGAVSAGSAINFAACKADNDDCIEIDGTYSCDDLANLLEGSVPAEISFTGGTVGDGCSAEHDEGDTAAAIVVIQTD